MAREVISSGNALVAKAAVECGCKFFGGYPITPSSEIAENFDIDRNGLLDSNERIAVKKIELNGQDVGSLKGIENFLSLS